MPAARTSSVDQPAGTRDVPANGRLTDPEPDAGTGLGATRRQVLDVLRRSDRPLGAAEVAERIGLHLNTARFHLDALVSSRRARRTAEKRSSPGRPKIVYVPVVDEPTTAGVRSFRLLAEMLTGLTASVLGDPTPAAAETGRAWGRHLADAPPPSRRTDAPEATRRLVALLDDIGFAPEAVSGGTEIQLHHCPFREVAEQHQDVVCAIHLGLMQGALSEMRAPVTAESLTPWVTPTLCVARLAPVAGEGAA